MDISVWQNMDLKVMVGMDMGEECRGRVNFEVRIGKRNGKTKHKNLWSMQHG